MRRINFQSDEPSIIWQCPRQPYSAVAAKRTNFEDLPGTLNPGELPQGGDPLSGAEADGRGVEYGTQDRLQFDVLLRRGNSLEVHFTQAAERDPRRTGMSSLGRGQSPPDHRSMALPGRSDRMNTVLPPPSPPRGLGNRRRQDPTPQLDTGCLWRFLHRATPGAFSPPSASSTAI
jgi:hypothetical protein